MNAPSPQPGQAAFHAIGVDVGGTKIAAGVVTFPEGVVRAHRVLPTAPQRGGEAVLADVQRLAGDLIRDACGLGLEVQGIGVGVCEIVDLAGDVRSANCVAWDRVPVRERLGHLAPVVVEADVRAAALAEAGFGSGKPFRSFLYVTIGTGISCCLVLDGNPFTGARGATGTMASTPLGVTCEACGRAETRTLEEIASGPALVARYNTRLAQPAASAEVVAAAANAGDATAAGVVESAAEALGAAVGLLVGVLDPEAVVVGGGLGLSGGMYWSAFMSSTRRHIWSDLHRELPILQAAKGGDAGVIGAAAAAWRSSVKHA